MADEVVGKSAWQKTAELALGAGLVAALTAAGAAFGNGKLDKNDAFSILAAFFGGVALYLKQSPTEGK